MTNKEKAKEIAGLCDGCLDERKNLNCQFDCANKGKYYGAMKMAEWKDQQFKEYLENKINGLTEIMRKTDLMVTINRCDNMIYVLNKIINDLFKED